MPPFDLIGQSYQSQSRNADAQLAMNWFPEVIESGQGNSKVAEYPTPGLKTLLDLSATKTGGVRGESTINGRGFAVIADTLVEFFPDTTFVSRGTVSNDGSMVTMASSPQQMLIGSAGTAYVFDLTSNVLTAIPGTTFDGPVSMVEYLEGFFLVLIKNSAEFYASAALDAFDWTTNGSAIVSLVPDNIVSMKVEGEQVYFASAKKTIPYYVSGGNFPLDVNLGGVMDQGIAAQFSFASLDNTLFWIGQDERGGGVVWRASGSIPQRVSNYAIEFAMQNFSTYADAIAYAYQEDGHFFYQIRFPTANRTFVYDVGGGWHERGFWDQAGAKFTAHRSQCHIFNWNMHLVGDWAAPRIYIQAVAKPNGGAWDFATDFNNPIRRLRVSPPISSDQKRLFHSRLEVFMECGLGTIDGGLQLPTAIGLVSPGGNFFNLGVTDNGILTTTPVAETVPQTVQLNDPLGTTSWQVGVNDIGLLTATPIALNPLLPKQFLISSSGRFQYELLVTIVGQLQTLQAGVVPTREPMIGMRFSNDSTKTWSNQLMRGWGNGGEFKKRVFWNLLGSSRNRNYELEVSEPVPGRLIQAFVETSAGAGT